MVGGDDQSASGRHILNSAKLNLPKHATRHMNTRPDQVERPLRQHRAGARSTSFLSFNRKCAVRTHSFILQRPFPIYELDVNSGNTIRARAARANRRMRCDAILVARQTNEPAFRYLQRGEDRCSFGADVFSHCMFTISYFAIGVNQLESHIDRDVVTGVNPLIAKRYQYLFGPGQRLKSRGVNVVTCPRFGFITRRRAFPDECDADVEDRFVINDLGLHVSHHSPDSILVLHVIEHAQLPRHRDRHVQETALFSRVLERETGAEWSDIREPGYLGPFESRRVSTLHAHGQMQWESLANSFPISLFTHGSRRTCGAVRKTSGVATRSC